MIAIWNGQIISESEQTILLEVNHDFPAESVRQEFLRHIAFWKGV